jgi:hypothetical protein
VGAFRPQEERRVNMVEKIAIESTEDFESETFKQQISVSSEVVNHDGTLGMVSDFYRIVHVRNGLIYPLEDTVFKTKDAAVEYAETLDNKELVSYDQILEQVDKKAQLATMVNEIEAEYRTKKESRGEIPLDDAQEIQKFDYQNFSQAIAHTIIEKNSLENAAKAADTLRWKFSSFLDEELKDVLDNIYYQIGTLQSSMEWVSEKMILKANESIQTIEQGKQLKVLVEDDLVNHETEKAYFVKVPKPVMKSDMDGLWIPKKIMRWNEDVNAYEVNCYQNFEFKEYQYSKENGKLGKVLDTKTIKGDEFKDLMLEASIFINHLKNIEESPSIVPTQSSIEEQDEKKGIQL